jgi:predicted transcriptional regulator
MQQPIDDRILEAMAYSRLMLSPTIIGENIGKSRQQVSERLGVLTDAGFVEKLKRGRYQIAPRGMAYVEGKLDATTVSPEE